MITFPRYSSKVKAMWKEPSSAAKTALLEGAYQRFLNLKVSGIFRISVQTPQGDSSTQTNSQHCAVSDLVQKSFPPRVDQVQNIHLSSWSKC